MAICRKHFFTVLLVACISFLCALVSSQQMQARFLSCFEHNKRCEIDCAFPDQEEGDERPVLTSSIINECMTTCGVEYDSCEDSEEVTAVIECATGCATTYDTRMLKCLEAFSTGTRSKYDSNNDLCVNGASWKMDKCMEGCYGTDRYDGWTPKTELGIATEEDEGEVFEVPNWYHDQKEKIKAVKAESAKLPPVTAKTVDSRATSLGP
mmetsp:Transcript_7565/g.10566  ORF Transcript_7565/g.10566 Transcript_7565/m.10566 type:complete len:209 (+) Transcript_7565:54-680(+)